MKRPWFIMRKLLDDRRAFAALEYTLISVVIGGVALTCVNTLGNSLKSAYNAIGTSLSNEVTSA